jgi:hypothetical protein
MYNPEGVGKIARAICNEWQIYEEFADSFVYDMMNQFPDSKYDFILEKLRELIYSDSNLKVLVGIRENEPESWYQRFQTYSNLDIHNWKIAYGRFYDHMEIWLITKENKKIMCLKNNL